MVPSHSRQKLAEALAVKLKHNHGYLKTGFVGTAYLPKVLSENGYNDLAYGLLLNEKSPSWLYAVNLGATTIWERWNSMLPDGKVNGTDMNSFNHYAYGSIVEWMYQYMVGLRPCDESPGFKKAIIAPMPDKRISSVDAVYPSAAGKYEVHWHYTGDTTFSIKIVIPFDGEAVVTLPFSGKESFTLEAGTYEYTYDLSGGTADGYTLDSSLADLIADPAAAGFLDAYFPGWQGFPANLTGNTIRQIAATPFFHFTSEELAEMERQLARRN